MVLATRSPHAPNSSVSLHMSSMTVRVRQLADLVMQSLGRGHREAVYHRAMSTALNREGIVHRTHVDCPIFFMGEVVGTGQADLIVDNLILELKVVSKVPAGASDQVKKYIESLYQTEKKRYQGIVLNFNPTSGKVDVVTEGASPRAEAPACRRTPSPRRGTPPRERTPPRTPSTARKVVSRYFPSSRASSRTSSRANSPLASPAGALWARRVTRASSVAF